MIKQVLSFKESKLRGTSPYVEPIGPYCKEVIQDLKDTFEDLGPYGAGLSAIQIGHFARVFVMQDQAVTDPKLIVMVNPKVESVFRGPLMLSYEGCLSIPGVFTRVQRPSSVTMSYDDEEGKKQKRVFNSLNAFVALHEYDHLNGTWFVDRAYNNMYRRLFWRKNKVKLKAMVDPYKY